MLDGVGRYGIGRYVDLGRSLGCRYPATAVYVLEKGLRKPKNPPEPIILANIAFYRNFIFAKATYD
jgi:hypothetical protein